MVPQIAQLFVIEHAQIEFSFHVILQGVFLKLSFLFSLFSGLILLLCRVTTARQINNDLSQVVIMTPK